jgi:hypothetical protein
MEFLRRGETDRCEESRVRHGGRSILGSVTDEELDRLVDPRVHVRGHRHASALPAFGASSTPHTLRMLATITRSRTDIQAS